MEKMFGVHADSIMGRQTFLRAMTLTAYGLMDADSDGGARSKSTFIHIHLWLIDFRSLRQIRSAVTNRLHNFGEKNDNMW